jgi:hypothetical protein
LTDDSREARDIEISFRFPWAMLLRAAIGGLLSGFGSGESRFTPTNCRHLRKRVIQYSVTPAMETKSCGV